jgi:hypothetical protein
MTELSDYRKSLKLARMILEKRNEKSNLKVKINPNMPSYFIPMKKQKKLNGDLKMMENLTILFADLLFTYIL